MQFRVYAVASCLFALLTACGSDPAAAPDTSTPDASSGPVELLLNPDFATLVPFAGLPQDEPLGFGSFANALLSVNWPEHWLDGFTQDREGAEVRVGPATSGAGFEIQVTDDPDLPYFYEVILLQAISMPPPGDYELTFTVASSINASIEMCPRVGICGEQLFNIGSFACVNQTSVYDASFTVSFSVSEDCADPSIDIGLWSFVNATGGDYSLFYRSISLTAKP